MCRRAIWRCCAAGVAMTATFLVHQAGPAVTVQDLGWHGYVAQGVSRGGAIDILAMAEGAALLGQSPNFAALEMAGFGGVFSATRDCVIALTGAEMRADLDGRALAWNATHAVPAGAKLKIGPVMRGVYGYLHISGGFEPPLILQGRGTHLAAGLRAAICVGAELPFGASSATRAGLCLDVADRSAGGVIRILPTLQSDMFGADLLAAFQNTSFTRDPRSNRMGVRLAAPDAPNFAPEAARNILSDIVMEGDIQITGDGTPYVLMAESQTTGGYPRIAQVLPCDLPRLAQLSSGAEVTFQMISHGEAVEIERAAQAARAQLGAMCKPVLRDPREAGDLLEMQLISGVTAGEDEG